MKFAAPITTHHGHTPAFAAGLRLAGKGHPRSAGWLHGALVQILRPIESTEAALLRITLVACTRDDQLPRVVPLVRAPALMSPPAWEEVPASEGAGWRLSWSLPSAVLLGDVPATQTLFVHAVIDDQVSNTIVLDSAATPTVLMGGQSSPNAALITGYELALFGNVTDAVGEFEVALTDGAIAADVDAAHRYNAACLAARAAVDNPEMREAFEQQAVRWLTDDLTARAQAHTRRCIQRALDPDAASVSVHATDDALAQHVEHVRRDRDLHSLRESGALARILDSL